MVKRYLMLGVAALACSTSAVWADSAVTVYGLVDQAVGRNIGSTEEEVIDSTGSEVGAKGTKWRGGPRGGAHAHGPVCYPGPRRHVHRGVLRRRGPGVPIDLLKTFHAELMPWRIPQST